MSQFTSVLLPDNFKTGETRLSQNQFDKESFKEYIADTQEKYLKKLLGDTLYLLFGAELPTPTLQKYTDLLNGVVYTHNDLNVDYTGLSRMLKLFTYESYVTDQDVQNTIIGNVSGKSRNSEKLTANETLGFAQEKYNKGVDYFKDAQLFVTRNKNQERTSTAIVDAAGTYTVSVESTLYMVIGDTFDLNGVDYVFTAVIEDVSFEFVAVAGLNLPNIVTVSYEIFPSFCGLIIDKSFIGGMIF